MKISQRFTAKPVVYMNIPLDAVILPVRLLSAQKENLVISQSPDETPEPYACAVTLRKYAKSTVPRNNFSRKNQLETQFLAILNCRHTNNA
jgi:hypothetical protein